jgi:alkaline phosphatase
MAPDEETPFPTNMESAINEGMATGILSDVYMCAATPGVWVAHYWRRSCTRDEGDGIIRGIIPQQLAACEAGGLDVFMGPGQEYQKKGKGGYDFIKDFENDCGYQRVRSASELASAQAPDGRLLYLEQGYTLTYDIDRQNDPEGDDPTLAEMTAKAIEVLKHDPDGFFLVVEGGGIDWMAHNRDPAGTARGVLGFDEAVAEAYAFAGPEGEGEGETLLVVTADHETAGLVVGSSPEEVEFLRGVKCSTDFMWGQIMNENKGWTNQEIADVCFPGLGVSANDVAAAVDPEQGGCDNSEIGLSRLVSEKAGVEWYEDFDQLILWDECDEGSHTGTNVPVYAYGPGSGALNGEEPIQNTLIGEALFQAVGSGAPDCEYPK